MTVRFLLVFALLFASQGFAIRNGSEAPSATKTVFALFNWNGTVGPSSSYTLGTGTNIRYKRCILTAAHVVDKPVTKIVQGLHVGNKPGNGSNVQDLRLIGARTANNDFRDIAVGWATQFTTGNLLYTPTHIDKTPDSLERGDTFGYGLRNSSLSSGTLRKGDLLIVDFLRGLNQTPPEVGSSYIYSDALYNDSGNHNICRGDSGGPIVPSIGGLSAGVFGVTTRIGNGFGCMSAKTSHFVGIDNIGGGDDFGNDVPDEQKTNWQWINSKIERHCGKMVSIDIKGMGTVSGQLTPTQYNSGSSDPALSSTIDCHTFDRSNCDEMVHAKATLEGFTLSAQHLHIVATPDPNNRFVRWEVGNAPGNCQCMGDATNPECVILEHKIGIYTATDSIDAESCRAVFEYEDQPGYSE